MSQELELVGVVDADAAGDLVAEVAAGAADMPSLSGDTADVHAPPDLIGRLVTFIITTGAVVVAVEVLGIRPFADGGGLLLIYRLPQCAADSACALATIGHLHVYARAHAARVAEVPGRNVYLGAAVPVVRADRPRRLR